jgi:hypothetical protein
MPNTLGKQNFKIRPRVIVFSLLGAIVVSCLIFGAYGWFLERQERVLGGFARPNFPYSDYSVEELGKMFPQYANENVITVRTPEETHKMFVERLKVGDLNGAVECCFRTGDWSEMKAGLEKVRAKGQLDLMVKDLDTEIKSNFIGDTLASFDYLTSKNGGDVMGSISFIKNNQGIWLIKSL